MLFAELLLLLYIVCFGYAYSLQQPPVSSKALNYTHHIITHTHTLHTTLLQDLLYSPLLPHEKKQ